MPEDPKTETKREETIPAHDATTTQKKTEHVPEKKTETTETTGGEK